MENTNDKQSQTYDEFINWCKHHKKKPQDNIRLLHFVVDNYKLREDFDLQEIIDIWNEKQTANLNK